MKIQLCLHVDPVPASRPRLATRGKFAHAYYVGRYKVFLKDTGPKALKAALESCGHNCFPLPGPLAVSIRCISKRPKTTKRHWPKMDVDNLAKGVLDVMEQGGVVVNDDQVTLLEVSKEYGGEPCIEIVIQVL